MSERKRVLRTLVIGTVGPLRSAVAPIKKIPAPVPPAPMPKYDANKALADAIKRREGSK